MKTKILWVFVALLALTCAVSAQSVLDNALSLHNVSVSPNPVVAGGSATIRFQLYNSYGSFVQTVNLQASGSYPIFNMSPANSTDIFEVNPGVNKPYYNYTFLIPATTPSGTYTVHFNASYYGLGATEVVASSSMPVSFYVQNKPAIKVLLSSPEPSALYSGQNQTVDLVIENAGYGTARNVTVAVSGGPGISILSSVTTFFISNLTQGSSVSEPLLIASQNVGIANIVASTSYYSSTLGQSFSSTQPINISIAPAAQFSIGTGAGASYGPGATDVPVSFTITNTGTSAAQQVQLSLQSSYPITPVASTAYIASLPAGATQNVTFLVSVDSQGVPGNYPVTLYEQWKQPNGAVNQQFSGSDNYFVSVSGEGATTLVVGVAIIVVVAAIAVFAYRRRKSTGRKQKK
ncbi:MAG: NEW3 domain-containing protein [Candidatus Marsarchaeota archaeon]|nr:NEW3 domain-containing protein [Candidatus Marsarchaeota archaeon]